MMRLIVCLLCLLAASAAQVVNPRVGPPDRGGRFEGPLFRIATAGAGSEGMWVRLSLPARPRFQEGAPVVVHCPGGLGPGGVGTAPARLSDFGFIDVVFLFPGGESGPPVNGKPLRSGGTYDSRGPASVRALADVIAFATGHTRSMEGKTIQDYAGAIKPLTDQAGTIGWSLGGTTIAAAMGLHGQDVRGLRWYASHESPYGEGVIDGEFGTRAEPSRFYHPDTGELDLKGLRYGPDLPTTLMGRAIEGAGNVRGALFLDGNSNGTFERETDFRFSGMFLPGPAPNVYYSPMLTRAAEQGKVFGDHWPAHIANLEQTRKAWVLRDGVSNIPAAVKNVPELAVIVFAGEADHVQDTADHRHILLQYGGFQAAGARWTRLNPDAHYVEWVLGRKPFGLPQNPAGAKFDRFSIRRAVMPGPPNGVTNSQALTAAACELADRTNRGNWSPALNAVLFPEAPRQIPRPPEGRQPRITVVFNMHLDPVGGPDPARRRTELEHRRDNMFWMEQFVNGIPAEKRPRLNLQMTGGHAEFFLKDEAGFDLMRRFWQRGHGIGTHFHRNIWLGEEFNWGELRPSQPLIKPALRPEEVLTPGVMTEPNTLDEVRRLWSDNFRFTVPLIEKITGITDPAEIRKINNHGEYHLPNSMAWKDTIMKEFGITVQTGGRNELFNMIFDHDVLNAWRPNARDELGEDVNNRAYVCVPQVAVPGNIKPHQGVMQDLSVPAMQRRFLQIVMERREHERLGLPPKIWTFGWTLHDFDIYPTSRGPNHSQRENVTALVSWINENFVPQVARWDDPNGVAEEFYAQEARQPGVSQFYYSERKKDWDKYPYRLKGAARELAGSHYVKTLADWEAQGVRAFELARVKSGSEWFVDEANRVQVRGAASPLVLAWAEKEPRKIDLKRYGAASIKRVDGVTGESSVADAGAAPVGVEPVIFVFE